MDFNKFFSLLILLVNTHRLHGDKYEYQLVNDLLQNYSKLVRPSVDHSLATKVTFSLSLRQIIDLDLKNQIISLYGWLLMSWNDTSLLWDPKLYNNITEIRLPSELIWKPDILLKNSVEKITFSDGTENMKIDSGGKVTWALDNMFRAYCQIDARYFPFDKQNCSLGFMSATYFLYQVEFFIGRGLVLDLYQNDTQFELVNTSATKQINCCPYPSSHITFYINIKRKPFYYLFNMVLPCIVTVAVAFLAFLVPNESGEKMSISITALLSIIVLLLVISDNLPPTSDYVPLIGIFYALATVFIAVISLISVLSLNIHHYGEHGKHVPKIIQKIFFSNFGKFIMFPIQVDFDKIKTINEYSDLDDTSSQEPTKKCKILCCSICKPRIPTVTPVDAPKKLENEKEIENIFKLQWLTLANILDRIALYIFFFVTVITFTAMLNSAAN